MATTVADETKTSSSRKPMYKHRFLRHPLVLLLRAATFFGAFFGTIYGFPLLPNPDPVGLLTTAIIGCFAGITLHYNRGNVMEFLVRKSKYYDYANQGHDKLYKVALLGTAEYARGAVIRLRTGYAVAEGASMIALATGLALFATIFQP